MTLILFVAADWKELYFYFLKLISTRRKLYLVSPIKREIVPKWPNSFANAVVLFKMFDPIDPKYPPAR